MEQALVTGATGFVGGHLARKLKRRGARVRVLARPGPKAQLLREQGFDVALGDLTDRESVDRAAQGCDVVFHVAALYRTDGVPDRMFYEVNVEGTRNVLESAQRHRARRVVHTSTVGVHGNIARPPADEDYPFGPRDAYQRSKCDGELLARKYFSNGLRGAVVRPVGVYGQGDTRFLKLFRAIARRRFVMLGDGNTLYQLTHVDDLTDGMLLCAERQQAEGRVYILGGGPATTLNELVRRIASALGAPAPKLRVPIWPFQLAAPVCQKVCRAIGVEPPLYPRRLEFFTDDRSFDISRARAELGYQPRIGLDDGIRETAAWYRQEGLL